MNPPFGLIANLENRRTALFVDAVVEAGGPSPVCLSWSELLASRDSLAGLSRCALVRIDSAGENPQVAQSLINLGAKTTMAPALSHGEVAHLDTLYRGFEVALGWVEASGLPVTSPTADIALMFDKWMTHQQLEHARIPRPDTKLVPPTATTGDPTTTLDELDLGPRIFLKPRYGSSASGVCALWRHTHGYRLVAPIEIDRGLGGTGSYQPRLFNSLKVRAYSDPADVNRILSVLIPQGMIAERWLPKAQLGGQGFDLRIVVIDGEARHMVPRCSRSPMTNLHLGSVRGDRSQLLQTIGSAALGRANEAAGHAARRLPGSLVIGVDVLLDQDLQPYVLELNAFGDLLPGITSRGQSTYQAAAAAMNKRAAHLVS